MKSDDFNSAAIDVVADVRPERVITESQTLSHFHGFIPQLLLCDFNRGVSLGRL